MRESIGDKWFWAVIVATWLVAGREAVAAEPAIQSVAPVAAEPLEGGVEWINTSQPLELPQLRGKLVLLDFWTYCCINCLQTLPDLQQLERAYPNELVVIGVHAPKFNGERDSENLREAIARHRIEHAVVNDANGVIARRYGVEGWPSLRFIDPDGFLIATHGGEATFKMLDEFVKRTLSRYRRKGSLDATPLQLDVGQEREEPTALRFPGKILADEASQRLFIADSGHNRIVITSLDGKLLDTIGTGMAGHDDGPLERATFAGPQGMALDDQRLYVADTENHLVRQVDLATRAVTTLAGTGQQAAEIVVRASRQPTRVRLASPWDLWLHDDSLYIAMAGAHQIWRLQLDRPNLYPFAGNGTEDIVDGPPAPRAAFALGTASFAQPSGLASDGQQLFVADSEGSSIRAIPLDRNGQVTTLLGTHRLPDNLRLFTFGNRDGPLSQALLQHPLAVAWWHDRLFVADTYNNKIKQIDLAAGDIRTFAGDQRPGDDDDPARFNEPAGLSVAGNKLYVADTNNHLIRVIELQGEPSVATLKIQGLRAVDIRE